LTGVWSEGFREIDPGYQVMASLFWRIEDIFLLYPSMNQWCFFGNRYLQDSGGIALRPAGNRLRCLAWPNQILTAFL
jgi:hypothetical protein